MSTTYTSKYSTPLSVNELRVLEFLEAYVQDNGVSPTFQEIKDSFGFASFNSVQRYLRQLHTKGYVHMPGGNQKRALSLIQSSKVRTQQQPNAALTPTIAPAAFTTNLQQEPLSSPYAIPLLGRVAAGRPLEAFLDNETVEVPPTLLKNIAKSFALQVSGQSMIEDGIFDGDILIVEERATAKNGEISVCTVNNEATVKRFYIHSGAKLAQPQIELRPANSTMESMWYSPEEVQIRGIVVGLLRKFF